MPKNSLLVGLLLVAMVISGVVLSAGQKPASAPADNNPSAGFIIGSNAIYVADQPLGQGVSIGVAKLAKLGFVVIHEDKAGAPGAILGQSALLAAGESQHVSITLSRATIDNETLYAMIHLDDGDGYFDSAKDAPAADTTGGGPVMMMFTVSQEATEPAAVSL